MFFIVILLTSVVMGYAATSRYNAPLPENALVLHSDYELREFTATHPDLNLDTANGGWVIQEPNGPVLAYVGDDLSKELDARVRSLELYEQLVMQKGVSENDISMLFEAAGRCSHPHCVNPGLPGKCIFYNHCGFCGYNHRCY